MIELECKSTTPDPCSTDQDHGAVDRNPVVKWVAFYGDCEH